MMITVVADLMNRMLGRLTCSETLELLQQYLDGELTTEEARRVAQHLDHCTRCDRESDIYRQIKISIAGASDSADAEVIERLERFGQRVGNG
ncbi:MAG: zf-HC2 domain-containing protein [Acidimicrobiia bacterium]|nr:zf-HC2 domain-containing protein [Acidimicrobiia bacterium]